MATDPSIDSTSSLQTSSEQDRAVGIIPVYTNGDEPLFCLIRDAKGFWGFPKGHQDPGEVELKTAQRELREEAGIEKAHVDETRTFSESYTYERKGILYDKTVIYYLAFVDATDNKTPEAFKKEIPDMRWLSYEEALALIREQSKPLLMEAKQYLESRG